MEELEAVLANAKWQEQIRHINEHVEDHGIPGVEHVKGTHKGRRKPAVDADMQSALEIIRAHHGVPPAAEEPLPELEELVQ